MVDSQSSHHIFSDYLKLPVIYSTHVFCVRKVGVVHVFCVREVGVVHVFCVREVGVVHVFCVEEVGVVHVFCVGEAGVTNSCLRQYITQALDLYGRTYLTKI
jgi:hypothetical protein